MAVAAALGASASSARTPAPKPATDVSTNWSGYSVTEPAGKPVSFTRATATWKQPRATCGTGDGRAAIWVGLGGAGSSSSGLAQIGTTADCRSGKPGYTAFYEVTPSPAVFVERFTIGAGDTITATVSIAAGTVSFRIDNLTNRLRFTGSLPATAADHRSAEWIVEAPAGCTGAACGQASLANFGSVSFTKVAVVGNGHAGTLLDPKWHTTAISLTPSRRQIASTGLSHGAVPKALAADGSSFTIVWRSQTAPAAEPTPNPVAAKPGPYIA
jgi:hypothetical protein